MFPPGSTDISKNGSVWIATSSPVSVPYTPSSSSAFETSIEMIFACAYGRADEVDVAHPVPADVVEERALTLDEPPILLARDRLPDEPLLERLRRAR